MDRGRWRRVAPPLLVGIVILCLVAPLVLGETLFQRDLCVFTYPIKLYLRERLLRGELPLWNETWRFGRPFLGAIQPGVLYPGNAILLLPAPLGVDLFFTLHLFVLAAGTRAWLVRLGVADPAASVGGGMVALSGQVVSLLVTTGAYGVGRAFVPWALAFAIDAATRPTRAARAGAAARVALCLALATLAGDPQATWFAGALCAIQALALGGRRGAPRHLALLGAAAVLATLVAAAQLLPARETAALGRADSIAFEEASGYPLHPARLLELIWPGSFGDPLGGEWIAYRLFHTPERNDPLATSIYLGLATPLLAVAGAFAGPARRGARIALATVAIGTLLLSLGSYTPLFRLFYLAAPGVKYFRFAEKYLFVTVICVAALAAGGLSAVAARPRRAAAVGAVGLAALVAMATLATFAAPWLFRLVAGDLGVSDERARALLVEPAWRAVIIGFVLWAPIAFAAIGRLRAARLVPLLGGLVLLDAMIASTRLVDWVDPGFYNEPNPIVDEIRRASAGDPAPPRLYRPIEGIHGDLYVSIGTLLPDWGMQDGINHLDPYDYFTTPDELAFWNALAPDPLRLLRITATRFALLAARPGTPAPPGMRLLRAYPRLHVMLVELVAPVPRAYLAARVRPSTGTTATTLRDPTFIPGRDAVVEGASAVGVGATGACAIREYRPERVTLTCDASAPTYAVLSDAWTPGWRATVDGAPREVRHANALVRAVEVPAGHSEVVLTYRPDGLVTGFVLSALGIALALALIAWSWWRDRSPSNDEATRAAS